MCPSMVFAFREGAPSRRSEQMRAQPVVLGHCGVCLGSRVGVRWEKHPNPEVRDGGPQSGSSWRVWREVGGLGMCLESSVYKLVVEHKMG